MKKTSFFAALVAIVMAAPGMSAATEDTSTYSDPALSAGISAPLSYTLEEAYQDLDIAELAGTTVKRVIAKGDYLYILALNGTAPTVIVYDHANKATVRTLGTTNCVGDILPLSDIALTGDNILVGCNKANQEINGTAYVKFYQWTNDSEGLPSGEASEWFTTNNCGNYNNAYVGESMCYAGSMDSGAIYYTAETTGSTTAIRIVGITITSGNSGTPWHMNLNSVSGYTKKDLGSVLLFASPNSDKNFIINGSSKTGAEFIRAETKATAPTLSSTLGAAVAAKAVHTGIFKFGGKSYMVAPRMSGSKSIGYGLYNISTSLAKAIEANRVPMSTSSTTSYAGCAGTSVVTNEGSDVKYVQLAVFMVRDGKVTKYITPETIDASGAQMVTSMTDYNFGKIFVGYETTTSFVIEAENLTDDVKLEISGTNASEFSISSTEIAKESANGYEVTVTYAPIEIGSHSAVLTISTPGAESRTYDLSGTALSDETATYSDPARNAGIIASDSYTLEEAYQDLDIAELAGTTVKRVIAKGDYLYILALKDTAPTVIVYDHANKATVRTLGTTDCVGDILPLSDIALTGDNVLVGCAKVNQGYYDTTSKVQFYSWTNDSEGLPSGEAAQWFLIKNCGNYGSAYVGESMCYAGSMTSGTIYYTAQTTADNAGIRIVGVPITSGKNGTAWHMNLNSVSGYTQLDLGSVLLFASPKTDKNFIINGSSKAGAEFVRAESAAGIPTLSSTLGSAVAAEAAHTGIFKYGGKKYMVAPKMSDSKSVGFALYDITTSLKNVAEVNSESMAESSTANYACCAGTSVVTKEGSDVKDVQLAMFMVRDGKVTKYITPKKVVVADPTMATTMKDHDFGEVKVGENASTSFSISASDLTDNVKVELSGDNASMFSLSAEDIAKDEANGYEVTVTYAPTEAGSHSAVLTVSTQGVESKSYSLTGTAVKASEETSETGITGLTEKWIFSEIKDNASDAPWLELSSDNVYTRGITLYEGALCVLNSKTSEIGAITRVNPYTGESIGTMSVEGIAKVGTHILSSINTLGSYMFGSNAAADGVALNIYRWDNASAKPVLALSTTNHGGVRVGDKLSVWGDDKDGRLMFFNSQTLVYYTVSNGVIDETPHVITLAKSLGGITSETSVVYAGDGTYWVFSKDYLPTHIAADGSVIESFTSAALPDKFGSAGIFFEFGGHKYLAATCYDVDGKTNTTIDYGQMRLIDYTDGISSAKAIGTYPADGLGANRNISFITSLAYEYNSESNKVNLWVQVPLQGIAYYSYNGESTDVDDIAVDMSAAKMEIRRYPSMIKILGVDPAQVVIYNMSGMTALTAGATDEVDTSALSGIHIIRVVDKSGVVHTAKIAL